MSQGLNYLHSHSALEGELLFPKHLVLVDEKYGDMFEKKIEFKHKGVKYYKVFIQDFVKNKGIFKHLSE